MFWPSFMISPVTLGSIYWGIRVMFLNDSSSLAHWLKNNVVDLLSVWDLTMVGIMWVDSLRIIWFSQVFHGRGMSLTLLIIMVLLNERIELWCWWLDVSCRQKTCWWSFGLKQSTMQTIYWTRFWWKFFVKWLLLRIGLVRNPLLVISRHLDVFPRHIFQMDIGRN